MASQFITQVKRTHSCGALRGSDVGKEVVLFGWVQNRRDYGGLIFIDLRDREGLTQVVFDPDLSKEAHAQAEHMRGEWVIGVRGKVRSRGSQVNPKLPTGEIEVEVYETTVFNRAATPPFEISEFANASEEVRL